MSEQDDGECTACGSLACDGECVQPYPAPDTPKTIPSPPPAPLVPAARKKRVIIESPFGKRADGSACTPAEMDRNLEYFWACVRDSLRRGEAPFGSHGFYPRAGLNDAIPEERRLGIDAGFAWADACELRVFYLDRGVTPGMHAGRDDALSKGQPVETRRLTLSEGVPPEDLELCK